MLWSDNAAADARRNLRQELSRLQATPANEWITAVGEDLALRGGAVIDVQCFRAALARGEREVAGVPTSVLAYIRAHGLYGARA